MPISELQLEDNVLKKLEDQKFTLRDDIRDRGSLEANFRKMFRAFAAEYHIYRLQAEESTHRARFGERSSSGGTSE